MITFEDTVTIATLAVVTVKVGGACLTLAIAGAAVEAMWPGAQTRILTRAWEAYVSGFYGVLRALWLVVGWPVRMGWGLAVTYLHLGYGRHTRFTHGEHRPVTVRRRHAGPTYNVRLA